MKIKFTLLFIASLFIMSSTIYLNNLEDYENLTQPDYINKDNTNTNSITDKGATLGRVLFYDKKLSVDNSISCSSCHLQEFAFGDTAKVSLGVNGVTGRHSMRLINSRFSEEIHAFWDERAATIEAQTTMPIQDHIEMGYSGTGSDPDLSVLITKMNGIDYYSTLFDFVFGDSNITEERIQLALAQFVRSIQSYDSKYDIGRAQVSANDINFPNFTTEENAGKKSFFTPPPLGGTGCFRCHGGNEFSIIQNCDNNGVIGIANSMGVDLTNTKSPTLRDLVNPQGIMNGPFMHDGSLINLMAVVNHYNDLTDTISANTNLDFRLQGAMHDIDLTLDEKLELVAFLKTLTGVKVYTEEKWSDPFSAEGNLTVLFDSTGTTIYNVHKNIFNIAPNPSTDFINLKLNIDNGLITIYNLNGSIAYKREVHNNMQIDISEFSNGIYILELIDLNTNKRYTDKIIKE